MSLPTTYPGLTSFQENILERGIKGKTYSTLSQCTFTRELETTKNETNPKRYLSRDDTKRTEDTVLVCMLCNWTGHENLWEHVTTTKHSHRYEQLKSRLLKDIPKESSLQMNSLREFLQTSYYSNCLHDYQYYIREDIIWKFKNLLSIVDSESHCRVVGSHVTRTSLNQSNLNIEVVHTNSQLFMKDPRAKNSIHHKLVNPDAENGMELNYHTMYYDLIPNAFETLHNIMKYLHNPYSEYREIFSVDEYQTFDDLNSTVPKLILNYIPDKIKLEITCYNQSGYKLSQLLKVYLSFDPRARELSSLVRYWASICRIDKPNLGTYPPETFVILVIFYLQRISPPILPCLHEMYSSFSNTGRANGPKTSTKSKLAPNITDEFSRLELCEDQGTSSDGIIDNTDISTDEKNLEDGLDNVDDDIGDEEEEDDAHIDSDSQEIENLKQNWVSLNDKPSYFLFIDFLKYMMEEFDSPYNVITIRTLKKLSLSNKRWHSRIKPIENPIRPLMNISRCIGSLRTFNYIKKCFERGFYYLTSVPLDTKLKPKTNYISEPQDFIKLYYESYRLDQYFSMKWTHGKPPKDVDTISEMIQQDIFARDVNEIDTLFDRTQMSYTDLGLLPRIVSQQYDKKHLIPQDSEAVIFCLSCKMFGHSKKQCPKAEVQKLYDQFKDYDHSLDSEANLDEIFGKMFRRDSISPNLYHYHNQITGQLSTMINSAFKGFNFELRRFGSTVNSLGTYDSDLDICMTLKNNPTGKGVDCIDILKNVCSVLSSVKRVSGLRPVLTARVPILRFKYANFEIDLSMYNRCAIHNSELLKKYSELDHRVKIIVYLVKRLAKICNMADASRGSLSSYGWSLMVIHYLQNTSPPVIPVLQEPKTRETPPTIGVSGWNVWFDKDIKDFKSDNHLSVTQLFKGFLLYYGCFEFDKLVVSIRKSERILRTQKNWNTGLITIEDPFELTYNLANRLDDPMAIYIMNTLAKAYMHLLSFQRKVTERGFGRDDIMERVLFDKGNITNENPPFRGCRICHRIGHKLSECPEKRDRGQFGKRVDGKRRN